MLRVYVDAATKGNPGNSAGGIILKGENLYEQLHIPLKEKNNHEAEFAVFTYALKLIIERELHHQTVIVHSDSKIVVETFEKGYAKKEAYQPYLKAFLQLEKKYELLIIQWIPESKNKGADTLARQALRKFY